jgi:type VI secretion system protein ImpA
MSILDINNLLQAVSPDAPSGLNLEYDPVFLEMVQAAEGQPARYSGKQIVEEAVPPDWSKVRRHALDLLSRSRDLRIGVYLTRALLHSSGFAGFNDGLALLQGLLEQFWDSVHPQLIPEDNNDPTSRVNALMSLCDLQTVLHETRETPLVTSPVLGRFNLHYVQSAQGKMAPPEGLSETPTMANFNAAFQDERTDLEAARQIVESASSSVNHLSAIRTIFSEKVGEKNAPSFKPLTDLLEEITKILSQRIPEPAPLEDSTSAEKIAEEHALQTAPGPSRAPASGQINSRADVIQLLEIICEYYDRNEPSSPVPLLLRRAKGLVSKDFMTILHDLAPEGVKQAELFRGADSKK